MQSILELKHLRLVQAIADEGGVTAAAEQLKLSQSALSHQLADIEDKLEVRLFQRVKRRLRLTAAGRLVYEHAQHLLPEMLELERLLRQQDGLAKQRMRVATECFAIYHWLPKLMPRLSANYPQLELRLAVQEAKYPIEALLKGKLELALVSSKVEHPALVVEPLFEDEWCVLVPATHPLQRRKYLRPAELAKYPLYCHEASPQDAARFQRVLSAEKVVISDIQTVPLTEVLVELVSAGLGLGLISKWAAQPYLKSKKLRCLGFTRQGLKETWSAVYRKSREDELPFTEVIEFLREQN